MANKKVRITKVRENAHLPESKNGNWYDCYVSKIAVMPNTKLDWKKANEVAKNAGVVVYDEGSIVVVYLGFATDLGKGYEGHLLARSSTFPNYGLILANSMGLIDDTYCGDGDEWRAVFYATRAGAIKIGERVCQMTIQKTNNFDLVEVASLGNEDRGGYGSTGK